MKLLPHWLHQLLWGLACLNLLTFGCGGPKGPDHTDRLALARAHLRAERYYSALSMLHDMPHTEQNTPELHLMQTLAYFKLEDYPHATTALEQANPQSTMLQIFLSYLYLLVGNTVGASSLADTLASQHGALPELALLRGNISLTSHQYQEAEYHFRTILAMDQTAVRAYIGLGHTALLQRRLGKAEEYYLRAVFLSTNEISPQLALVNFYVATQRYDDAEDMLKLSLEGYPDDIMLQTSLINLYIKTHKSQQAVDLLEAILVNIPFSDYIKVIATRQYFSLHRLDDAYKVIDSILAQDKENYYGLLLYGEYLFRKQEYELSLSYFHQALIKNSNSREALYYIGVIHYLLNNVHIATYFLERSLQVYYGPPNAHLFLAAIYLQSRKYILASEYAKAILNSHPENVDAHLMNGLALYLQGYFNPASYEFDVAQILDPQNPSAKVFRALIELEQRHFNESEKYLNSLTSSDAEKIFLQGQILQERLAETASSQQQLGRYFDTNHDPIAWLILGQVYDTRADYSHAETAYGHAMAAHGTNVLPYYAMAQLELKRANPRQAIAYLKQAIAINSSFTKSYRALGSLYEQEKDYLQARAIYERGLQYSPDDPILLNNLAWAHLMPGGDVRIAYVRIRQAVSLAPEDPDLQDTLAWWSYLTHDFQQATTLLKKIVKAHPEHAIYRYHLGMAHLENGEHEEARHHLRQALNLGIDAEHRRLIKERLP